MRGLWPHVGLPRSPPLTGNNHGMKSLPFRRALFVFCTLLMRGPTPNTLAREKESKRARQQKKKEGKRERERDNEGKRERERERVRA